MGEDGCSREFLEVMFPGRQKNSGLVYLKDSMPSPGYMQTKLTKTVLENDPELKASITS